MDGLQLNGRNIEIKRSLKKGFVPADTTNFTSSTKFTGIYPSGLSSSASGGGGGSKNVNSSKGGK